MDALDALTSRRSASKLIEPGPSERDLALVLDAAVRAPDHGRLRPWRFLVLNGDDRLILGEAMAYSLRSRQPEIAEEQVERERDKVLRAPTIIVAAAAVDRDHPKIPEIEQVMAVGAAAQNMMVALHALGYGAMWKTGDAAYDDRVKATLGLAASDHIVGFIYAGTAAGPAKVFEVDRRDYLLPVPSAAKSV